MPADARLHSHPIRARLLGPVEIRVGDTLLDDRAWPRRHARSVLLLLLCAPGFRLPRDVVLDALWPDRGVDSSLNALYKATHTLRRTLEPGLSQGQRSAYLDVTNENLALRPHDGLRVDVDQFEHLLREADMSPGSREPLRAALALYRGDFVADEPYSDWPIARREGLRVMRTRAVLSLARLDLEQGDPLASLGYLESLLADDPTFEEAHQAIIRALLASGQRVAALHQVERCRLALDRDLGVPLGAETEALANRARLASAVKDQAIPQDSGIPLINHPGTPSRTVGREADIQTLASLLATSVARVITIVGPGGVGKTRLAVDVARAAATDFPNGVAFVDLTAIRSETLLFQAIAGALSIPELRGRDLASTVRTILTRRPRFLLVLDNFEHLDGIAGTVAGLLADVPSLTMLGTSRQPLRIRAERVHHLQPLPVPHGGEQDLEVLRTVDSVVLFLECASAWGGTRVSNDSSSLQVVASICQRLEGLPLAIELAAARCWELSPEEVYAQLDDRFGTLGDGPRDLPPRHRRLDDTIAWSYDLLAADEQALLRSISVFAGGIDRDVLQEMFGLRAPAMAGMLVEKNLLRQDLRSPQRLSILETVRAFARRRLRLHGDEATMQLAHARYFAHLLHASPQARSGMEQVDWEQQLELEHGNLHLALATSLAIGDGDLAVRLASGLGRYWFVHGCTASALRWIEDALRLAGDTMSDEAAWTALWGAALSWRLNDVVAGERYEQRAREIWRALGSRHGVARVDHALAIRYGLDGRLDLSLQQHRQNLDAFAAMRDAEGIVFSHAGFAHALGLAGERVAAVDHLEVAYKVASDANDFLLLSYVLAQLPTAHAAVGNRDRAAAYAIEGERMARLVHDRRSLPWASLVQAMLASDRQDNDAALRHAREALAGFQEAGDVLNEWVGLLACLRAATALGRLDDASLHAEACLRLKRIDRSKADMAVILREVGSLLLAGDQPAAALAALASGMADYGEDIDGLVPGFAPRRYHECIAMARSQLTPEEAATAWRCGEGRDVMAAANLALAQVIDLRA